MRRKNLYTAVFLILIISGSVAAAAPIGTVIGVSGEGAKIYVAGTDYAVDAAPGKKFNSGDTIVTPAGALVSVMMNDGSQIKINENSRATIRGKSNPDCIAQT